MDTAEKDGCASDRCVTSFTLLCTPRASSGLLNSNFTIEARETTRRRKRDTFILLAASPNSSEAVELKALAGAVQDCLPALNDRAASWACVAM